jgi:hypothetical protein
MKIEKIKKIKFHCGACKKEFKTARDLIVHLQTCETAKTLMPVIEQIKRKIRG